MRIGNALRQTVSVQAWAFLAVVAAVSFLSASTFWWTGIGGSFLSLVLVPPLVVWAVILLLMGVIGAVRRRRTAIGALAAVLIFPDVFVLVFAASDRAWDRAAFAFNYSKYSKIVSLSQQGRLPPRGEKAFQTAANGLTYEAERRGAGRVAFALPGGFLNQWTGVLYDPSGIGRRNAEPGGTDLFDDWWTVESCSHMIGRYFVCDFS